MTASKILKLAAAIAAAASFGVPSMASAQSMPLPTRGEPSNTETCDTIPGYQTTHSGSFSLDARYAKPTTFYVSERGPVRACLWVSALTTQNTDIYLERQPLSQPIDTPWETIKTTKGAPWYLRSTSPYSTFEALDATINMVPGYRLRWRLQQVTGVGQYKFMITEQS